MKPRRGARAAAVALFLLAVSPAAAPPLGAQQDGRLEYEVKAAHLYRFTQYVEWPPGAPAAPPAPVVICVLGPDPFGAILDSTVADRRTDGREIRVRRIADTDEADDCGVVFIAEGQESATRRWLAALRGRPVVTVGEGPAFVDAGGMIAFVLVERTVRFEVHLAPMREAGVQLSSRVLRLATRIHDPAGERE